MYFSDLKSVALIVLYVENFAVRIEWVQTAEKQPEIYWFVNHEVEKLARLPAEQMKLQDSHQSETTSTRLCVCNNTVKISLFWWNNCFYKQNFTKSSGKTERSAMHELKKVNSILIRWESGVQEKNKAVFRKFN